MFLLLLFLLLFLLFILLLWLGKKTKEKKRQVVPQERKKGGKKWEREEDWNTSLLDYNIAAADGTEDRGARTPAEMGNEIIRKLREASDFAQAAIAYA